jgi:hypothetical protein
MRDLQPFATINLDFCSSERLSIPPFCPIYLKTRWHPLKQEFKVQRVLLKTTLARFLNEQSE